MKVSVAIVFCTLLLISGCEVQTPGGDALVQEGLVLRKQQEFDVAIEKFDAALSMGLSEYSEAEVHNLIGTSYDSLDLCNEAIAAYEKSIALDSSDVKVWTNKGVSHRMLKQDEEAMQCYQKAIALDPNYMEAHGSLGVLYLLSGKPEEAVASLQKAIEMDPEQGILHGNLAWALGMLGSFDEADASLREAVRLGYANAEVIQGKLDELTKGNKDE